MSWCFITVKGHRENDIPRIMMNNTLIKRVTGFNVLGLTVNKYMDLNSHTKIAHKISHVRRYDQTKTIPATPAMKLMYKYDLLILSYL